MPTIEQARLLYQDADPVHDFEHVLRVYRIAERLALAEGADLEIVHAAALLHDSRGSAPGGSGAERLEHHITSAQFAGEVLQQEGWSEERIQAVQHCIRAHRFRHNGEKPQTLEAKVLFDADKLDAIGAIGVARAIAYAVKAGAPVFCQPSQTFLATGQLENGERHSAYHEFLFKLQKISSRMYTQIGKVLAKDRHQIMEIFFEKLMADALGKG